jgi:hypothetical protein
MGSVQLPGPGVVAHETTRAISRGSTGGSEATLEAEPRADPTLLRASSNPPCGRSGRVREEVGGPTPSPQDRGAAALDSLAATDRFISHLPSASAGATFAITASPDRHAVDDPVFFEPLATLPENQGFALSSRRWGVVCKNFAVLSSFRRSLVAGRIAPASVPACARTRQRARRNLGESYGRAQLGGCARPLRCHGRAEPSAVRPSRRPMDLTLPRRDSGCLYRRGPAHHGGALGATESARTRATCTSRTRATSKPRNGRECLRGIR